MILTEGITDLATAVATASAETAGVGDPATGDATTRGTNGVGSPAVGLDA